MKLKNIIFLAISVCSSFTLTSCNDYLDVSKEMNENLTMDKVFVNPTYTRNWYGNIYGCVSDYSDMVNVNPLDNPWSNMCGEVSSQAAATRDVMVSGFTAGSAQCQRWTSIYQYIRQAMIFIRDANDEGVGSGTNRITSQEIARMKDDARFLLAYCYYSLFEMYGPVPIVRQIDDAAYPQVYDYERASVDETVNHIDSLLADVLSRDNLPTSLITAKTDGVGTTFNLNEVVRPTKIAAMALRARLWVFAASPLYNGGWDKAMALKNDDGKQLFPAKDKNKWVIAKQHLEELLDACTSAGHTLYEVKVNGSIQPEESIYKLFQIFNQEILWCDTNNSYSGQWTMEKYTNPRDVNNSYGTVGPTQESVDRFFTKSGLGINEDNNYHEDALVDVINTAYDDNCKDTHTDHNIFNMYSNREPRFYQDVIYQGKSWYKVFMNMAGHENYIADFSPNGGSGPTSTDTPLTGYMLGKFKNRIVNDASGYQATYSRVWIQFRLADFFLYYAEVLNEIDPTDSRIVQYIDYIRERAGIPTYAKLAETGVKDIRGDYQKQWEAIEHERFVELYCEGQRYFDIRRWMICGKGKLADQTKFSGMNEYGSTEVSIGQDKSFYKRTSLENRQWDDKMYLYPIPQSTIQLGQGRMVQNPGW